MNDARTPCYLIFKRDGSGEFPMYRTSEGRISLILFRSRESAQAFADGKGMASEWKVEERSQEATVEWIRDAVKRYGASDLAIDPDPVISTTDARVISIVQFLIE